MTTMLTQPTNPYTTTLQAYKDRIDRYLQQRLPSVDIAPRGLHEAMHYVVFSGGKRVRPLLVYAIGELFQTQLDKLDPIAAAIECIHCYSLVHDDLPAMDNDTFRRGRLTCHKAFDETTAILVGDALQSLAFAILANASTKTTIIAKLADAIGSTGMVGGQFLDLLDQKKSLDLAERQIIRELKTGALLAVTIQMGVEASDCIDPNTTCRLHQFGKTIGLIYQIEDDIKDKEALDHDKEIVTRLYKNAFDDLTAIRQNTALLKHIVESFRAHRKNS